MNSCSWYRVSKDIELKDGTTVKLYRTVFETTDHATSEESVEWCRGKVDLLKKSLCTVTDVGVTDERI